METPVCLESGNCVDAGSQQHQRQDARATFKAPLSFVYSEGGTLLGKDDLEDDNPIVEFFSTKSQTIRVKVKNTGRYTDAYDGEVYVSPDQR